MRLRIPANFEGQTVKRYGEVAFRFRIGETALPEALKCVVSIGKTAAAKMVLDDDSYVLGKVEFGGIRVDRQGESVLTLESNVDDVKMPMEELRKIVEEDITLVIGWK